MSARPSPTESPPLSVIAPFFLTAPLGLFVAGLLIAGAGDVSFRGINVPRNVGITHALVLGWVTTTMMGAIYQMGPAIIGGKLWSQGLARVQLAIHALGVGIFIYATWQWDVDLMGIGGTLLVVSLLLFIANAGTAIARAKARTVPRAAAALGLGWLVVAGGLGITWVGTLQHLWFPITMGRLSAHAHIGLFGWLAITLMGISYQLVPMFNVITRVRPRFGRYVLTIGSVSLAIFALVLETDPAAPVRVACAVLLAVAPALWGYEMARALLGRSKRRLDIHGRGTFVSLGWLAVTIVLGVIAASGTPFIPGDQSARWLLAYGAAGIGGWMGSAMIANSFKILPFLIWIQRYRSRIGGSGPVPMVSDIYSERMASTALAVLSAGVAAVTISVIFGSVDGMRAGGVVLSGAAVIHFAGLAHMFLPKQAGRAARPVGREGVTV